MNGKILPFLVAVLVGMNAWILSIEIRKAEKGDVTDRWRGTQQIEYKIYVESRFEEVKEIKDIVNNLEEVVHKLTVERGIDSRGSESE